MYHLALDFGEGYLVEYLITPFHQLTHCQNRNVQNVREEKLPNTMLEGNTPAKSDGEHTELYIGLKMPYIL